MRFLRGSTLATEIGIQILIVFVGGAAFHVRPIGGREWGISLALGVVSIPLGVLVRLMPNAPFEKLFTVMGLLGRQDDVLPTTTPGTEGWGGALNVVRDNLSTFAGIRGARLRSSSFVVKSRSARPKQEKVRMFVSLHMSGLRPLTDNNTQVDCIGHGAHNNDQFYRHWDKIRSTWIHLRPHA